ncbi:unnamed protein product [Vitrella brassicaformis CCMP3155]|uniref:ABC3 transporter permease C-terminal domain-containing protein n=2 Tax=Vitrella brassicaformis TaxID=1169539 RepID=A0A0G4GRS2_VITBC|nr:unnamed protein product [Vitrella brassicaformis CCMP3155]|eukprot:CEM33325.1 unnamed protein product [Vitrella brassicaformis CCMP3155]
MPPCCPRSRPDAGDGDEGDAGEASSRPTGVRGWKRFTFFVRSALSEIRRRKCAFLLGFLSCLLVVAASAIVSTVTEVAPAIFLRRAEGEGGQIDVEVYGRGSPSLPVYFRAVDRSPPFINYTVARSILMQDPAKRFAASSPRVRLEGVNAYSMCRVNRSSIHTAVLGRVCGAYELGVQLVLIDTNQERKMGLGRDWPFDKLDPATAVLAPAMAGKLRLTSGQEFIIAFYAADLLVSYAAQMPSVSNRTLDMAAEYSQVRMPVVFASRFPRGAAGKVPESEANKVVFMELETFHTLLAQSLDPWLDNSTAIPQQVAGRSVAEFATSVVVNYAENRISNYLRSNFDSVQVDVTEYAADVRTLLSWDAVICVPQTLKALAAYRFGGLFVGLVLNLIVFILFVLSIVLVYSLLLISVETKTFQLGILRMIGLNRRGLVELILIQALSYVLPALVFGLLAAVGGNALVARMFYRLTRIPVSSALSWRSIVYSCTLGILIPVVASFLPIKAALQLNIHEALDVHRSKTKVVAVQLERTATRVNWTGVLVGLLLAVFGFCIYYLVPLALISFNIALFTNIFFAVLMGMLFGFVVLSLNLEQLVERAVVFIFLWWETTAVKRMVLNNLVAHRLRNRKTTIMYAVALAFIIFLMVSYTMELETSKMDALKQKGTELAVDVESNYRKLEGILQQFMRGSRPPIHSYASVSTSLDQSLGTKQLQGEKVAFDLVTIENIGHLHVQYSTITAVSPNVFDTTGSQFLRVSERIDGGRPSGLSLTEYLYTVRGSSSGLMGAIFKDKFQLQDPHLPNKQSFLVTISGDTVDKSVSTSAVGGLTVPGNLLQPGKKKGHNLLARIQPAAFVESAPAFYFSKFPDQLDFQNLLVSYPTFLRLAEQAGGPRSVRQLGIERVLVDLRRDKRGRVDVDGRTLDAIVSDLSDYSTVSDYRDIENSVNESRGIMDVVFAAAAVVVMVLCFFSLVSSMAANIFEQTKEMAILRSIGVTKARVTILFIYEAFVLITSASVLGLSIGMAVGWTMTAQRALFTQLPLTFVFPYWVAIAVVATAALSATLASYFPASSLLRLQISELMRFVT